MILTDVRQNKLPGSKHTSLTFFPDPGLMTLDILGNLFATFSVSAGQLQRLDGTVVSPTDYIYLGDELKVVLSSPNQNGASAASVIYQNNTAVGYFVLTTENVVSYSYDSRYDDLFSSEVVPDIVWVPEVENSIKSFDFDGVQTGNYDLTQPATNLFAMNSLVALDFQRDVAVVFNTENKTVARRLVGNGPVSSSDLYGTDLVRAATAIAFNKENSVKIYDSYFTQVRTINFNDVAGVYFYGNILYVWSKSGTQITAYTINRNTLAISSQQDYSFSGTIQAVVSYAGTVYVLSQEEIVTLNDTVVAALDAKARNAVVVNNYLYVTHGANTYVSKIDLANGFANSRLNIVGANFLDSIVAQPSGRIYITDVEANKIYVREQFNQDWDVGFGGYGIAVSDQIYVFDAYPTMPSKIDIDTLKFTLDTSAFVDIEDFPLGNTGITGAIEVLTANRSVRVQLFPASPFTTLMVNGVDVADITTVNVGDILTVRFDYEFGQTDPMMIGLAIDQQVFISNVYVDDSRIVPFDFKFESRYNVTPNTQITSNIVSISHLTAPVTVKTSLGILIKNGLEVGGTTTIANGDTLAVKVLSSADNCEVVTARITIQDPRFETPFSVSTVSDIPDLENINRPILEFTSRYDQPLGAVVYSDEIHLTGKIYEPTTFNIPEFYDAQFILNGVPSGREIVAQTNDRIKIQLTTTYNYDTPHHVAISTCYGVGQFIAYTVGDTTPDAFNFGTIQGAYIKDFLTSNIAYLTGIGNAVSVPILIPYGTELYLNGLLVENNAPKDWRGMPLIDKAVMLTMSNGDNLMLKGYPRPIQGNTVNIPVYVGGRKGLWTINTFDNSGVTQGFAKDLSVAQAPSIVEVDWIEQHSLTRIYDVIVNKPAPRAIAEPVVEVLQMRLPVQAELDYVVSTSHDVLNPLEFNIDAVRPSSLMLDNEKTIDITSAIPEIFMDLPDVMLNGSNRHNFDQLLGTFVNASNQLLTDLDLALHVNNTNQTYFENVPSFDTISNGQHFIQATAEYMWNNNTQIYATVFEVDRYEGETFTHGYVQIATEYVVVRFDYKPFDLFDLSDGLVFRYAANPQINREFVWQNVPWITPDIFEPVYSNNSLVQINPTDWIKLEANDPAYIVPEYMVYEHNEVVAYDPVFKVEATTSPAKFSGTFTVSSQSNAVKFTPDYIVQSQSENVRFIPTFYAENSNRINLFDVPYLNYEKSRRIYLDRDINAVVNKTADPIVFDLIQWDHTEDRFSVVVSQDDFVEQSRTYLRSPVPNVLHPGYFNTKEDAEDNAVAHGYGIGQFYALHVDEKGWAWTRVIPCANLCNPDDCPPSGYIHGG